MAKEETDKVKTTNTNKTSKSTSSKSTTKKATTNKTTKDVKEKKAPVKTTKPAKVEKTAPKIVQEENHYGRTLLAAFIIIIIFIGGYLAVQFNKNGTLSPKEKYVATEEEKKFKEEYESLNGKENENGVKNKDVTIIEDNNIKYISMKEASEMLDSGSGVIYFGYASCNECRQTVPLLLNAMQSTDLETIYYVNIRPDGNEELDLRDKYKLDNRNKARREKEGEAGYNNVLLALANELDDYVLKSDNGASVNTGEKRLIAPTVVSVKNGYLTGIYDSTDEEREADSSTLTETEKTEIQEAYTKVITDYLESDCQEGEGC